MKKALLIPIKEPARAKTRLAKLLTLEERRQLVWAMFEDVCQAVAASSKAAEVFLVTNFQQAAAYARLYGWQVLLEDEQESESASVDWASRRLHERGFDAVMRLPADLPLVQAEDLDALLAIELNQPAALLVPSLEGSGTNAIIRTPADLFPSRFGPDSLRLHKEEALRVEVECLIIHNPRIALDIDEPQDLQRFLSVGHKTQTFRLLEAIKIHERLAALHGLAS
ncbi:MAG: 2-phospho-L-lactate guanylyltransferase [Acidobacteria bacterium]|nr:2-phospho-L-lactate guanylyltransferase [Acidobacteriota bacterium]